MWSERIAREIAATLGCSDPLALAGVVGQMADALRRLPPDKIRRARDFARWSRDRWAADRAGPPPDAWVAEKLQEVRDLLVFLGERYGYSRPVEESDTWTEEDRRDLTQTFLPRRKCRAL